MYYAWLNVLNPFQCLSFSLKQMFLGPRDNEQYGLNILNKYLMDLDAHFVLPDGGSLRLAYA